MHNPVVFFLNTGSIYNNTSWRQILFTPGPKLYPRPPYPRTAAKRREGTGLVWQSNWSPRRPRPMRRLSAALTSWPKRTLSAPFTRSENTICY